MSDEKNLVPAKPADIEIRGVSLSGGTDVTAWLENNVGPLAIISEKYAKSGLVPVALANKPEAVFTVLTTGIELGIGPATALRTIHVVQGRATLSADLMAGLAVKAGASYQYVVSNDKECRIRWSRGASSGEVSFTWEDAVRAKLTGKETWKMYPTEMLASRCKAKFARQAAPDLLAGLYDPDEISAAPTAASEPDQTHSGGHKAPSAAAPPSAPGKAVEAANPSPEAGGGSDRCPPVVAAPAEGDPESWPKDRETLARAMWAAAGELGCKSTRTIEVPPGSGNTKKCSVIEWVYPEVQEAIKASGGPFYADTADAPGFIYPPEWTTDCIETLLNNLNRVRKDMKLKAEQAKDDLRNLGM